MVLLALGAFNVSVKYLFKPKGRRTWHYRRHVPSSVKAHYAQPHILKSLQTEDDVEAAKLATGKISLYRAIAIDDYRIQEALKNN